MVLLSFALGWYSGLYTNQPHLPNIPILTAESALSFSGKYTSSHAIKPISFLQELENQVKAKGEREERRGLIFCRCF
jgi:hypothetical protein